MILSVRYAVFLKDNAIMLQVTYKTHSWVHSLYSVSFTLFPCGGLEIRTGLLTTGGLHQARTGPMDDPRHCVAH